MQDLQYGYELHAFLDDVPGALKARRHDELRERCSHLVSRAREPGVARALTDLHGVLDGQKTKKLVMGHYVEAMRAYESWLATRRKDKQASPHSLAPLRVARTLFHASMGVLAVVMYQFVLTRAQCVGVLTSLLVVFGTLEIGRRFSPKMNDFLMAKIFGLISRPNEAHRLNSATWYLLALLIVTPLFSKEAVIAGILALAFGDPAAAWFGKRLGRVKLYRQKSYAGTAAFIMVAFSISALFLCNVASPMPIGSRLLACLAAAVTGALAELFTTRFDDNFSVPLAATLAAAIVTI
jgi:dolichol kinase